MTDQRTIVQARDHVLIITLNRHAKRNAIDGEMTLALDAALNRLEDDPDLWVGVITGGPNMFCAGTDMAATSGPPTARGGILCEASTRVDRAYRSACGTRLTTAPSQQPTNHWRGGCRRGFSDKRATDRYSLWLTSIAMA